MNLIHSGSAGGAGVMLFVIGFLSYCIVINIQDRQQKIFLNITLIDLVQFPGESTRSSWRCRKTPGEWVTWLKVAWRAKGRARGRAFTTESQECHSDSNLRNKVFSFPHIIHWWLVKYRQGLYIYRVSQKKCSHVWEAVTLAKITLQSKVRWVLKSTCDSLSDGHWNFHIWTIGTWEIEV